MKGQKVVSIITILACIFTLIAGVMGLNYVSDMRMQRVKRLKKTPLEG